MFKPRKQYELVSNVYKYHLERSAGELEMDDRVYLSCMAPHVSGLPENVRHIWGYAFSEMINNVIDHSGSPSVDIIVRQDHLSTFGNMRFPEKKYPCPYGAGSIKERIMKMFTDILPVLATA